VFNYITIKSGKGNVPLRQRHKEITVHGTAIEILKSIDQKIFELKNRFDMATEDQAKMSDEIKKSSDELEVIKSDTNELLLQNQDLASTPVDNSAN